jgi:hypothetical protein
MYFCLHKSRFTTHEREESEGDTSQMPQCIELSMIPMPMRIWMKMGENIRILHPFPEKVLYLIAWITDIIALDPDLQDGDWNHLIEEPSQWQLLPRVTPIKSNDRTIIGVRRSCGVNHILGLHKMS